jgi:CRP-like cAMP-binding protein
MSSSDKDDLLGKLLGPLRRDSQPAGDASSAKAQPADNPAGLNPLDLLGLPLEQRDLINWLSRRKQARFDDLVEALGLESAQLTGILAALKSARHVQEALIDGEVYYRVVFGGKVSRAARGLPEGIWDVVDLDNTVFLHQIPLFQGLSHDELRELANKLEARQYHRNEVILWQGGLGEGVYFIKSGIVGISRLLPDKRGTQILTYLKQGDLLGEYGLLFEQNVAASATATALSEVDVLLMKRQEVLELLKKYPSAAIALIQMLAQRLLAADEQSQPKSSATLCLVLGVEPGVGATTVGSALAAKIAQTTGSSVVYTEHPLPGLLPGLFGLPAGSETQRHPGGYDIYMPQGLSGVPSAVRTTLVMDRLVEKYAQVVVGVSGEIDETVIYMLERAAQVVVVLTPDKAQWDRLNTLRHRLKAATRPDKTSFLTVCNRPDVRYRGVEPPGTADYNLPWFDALPPFNQRAPQALPGVLAETATSLASRLGRTNQIGIYIPAEQDPNAYVEQAMAFLSTLFGRTAEYPSYALSDREPVGAAGEKIYLVQAYVTKSALDRHLGDVLAFVEKLKTELNQDVMALEVNRNLMLV